MRGKRWIAVAFSLLPLLASCGSSQGGSDASCVGPYLNDQPPAETFRPPRPTVGPGSSLTLYGHWYTSTCNDTGGNAPLKALPPVRLTISLPGGPTMHLGPFTPMGRDMGFSTKVQLPAQTSAGIVTVRDDGHNVATYKFAVGSA